MQVLLLNNVPASYFNPLFELIGRESVWDLTVCYSSDWNKDVAWRESELNSRSSHRTVILDSRFPAVKSLLGSSVAAALSLTFILVREKPEYLICYGYTLSPQICALLWSMLTRTPYAVVGDANYFTDRAKGLKRWMKNIWLGLVTRNAAALIAIGTANRLFWESYGASQDQLYEARYAVDNNFYKNAAEQVKTESLRLREEMGLDGRVVFLFVGRLVRRKNVDLIVQAVSDLNDDRIAVVIAGDGEERQGLEKISGGHPGIVFAGRVEPNDLPLFYGLSDVLVLPADNEPWGLVVNEAMASGLAVIAHKDCGATVDLVSDDNGYVLKTFSVSELADAMKRLAHDDKLRESMRHASSEKIRGWSVENAAAGIVRALEESNKTSRPEVKVQMENRK